MENIKSELKKNNIKPISIHDIDSENGITIFRVDGKKENLDKFFDLENIWNEDELRIGRNRLYGINIDWYVKLKNNDPRLPGIKEMMVDRLLDGILKKHEKRVEIITELRKKWNVEVWEWVSGDEMSIYFTVENCELKVHGKNLVLDLDGRPRIIDENKPTQEIIEEISNLLKRHIIEKNCKREK